MRIANEKLLEVFIGGNLCLGLGSGPGYTRALLRRPTTIMPVYRRQSSPDIPADVADPCDSQKVTSLLVLTLDRQRSIAEGSALATSVRFSMGREITVTTKGWYIHMAGGCYLGSLLGKHCMG